MNQTIGDLLRQARMDKNLTLEGAAQALHIRIKYLEALETDQPSQIPSKVQGKGFLRLYSAYLGLPVQPLLDLWEGRQPAQSEIKSEPVNPKTDDQPPSPLKSPTAIASVDSQPQAIPSQPEPDQVLSQSGSSFAQIGKILAERRQLLNLNLEEVERFTHVRKHYLQALENGRLEDLPSPVQGRGMLNNVAHFLNLDADELLAQFAKGLQHRRLEKLPSSSHTEPGKSSTSKPSSNHWSRLLTPDLIIVGSVIIGLVIFAIWSAAQVTARQREVLQATPPSISEVLLSASPQKPAQSSTPSLLPNIGTRQPELTSIITRASVGPDLTGTVPVLGSGQLQIYVVASQRSYLRVTADSRIIFDERLVPGNAYAFAGNQRLEILLSNAAGVRIFFNQQDLGYLGVVGEVKNMVFTKDGIITPTIAFTPTPSRTPNPSATARLSPTAPMMTITPLIP